MIARDAAVAGRGGTHSGHDAGGASHPGGPHKAASGADGGTRGRTKPVTKADGGSPACFT
jgi:hypothetical protein